MYRRDVLALLAAGLPGCSLVADDPETVTPATVPDAERQVAGPQSVPPDTWPAGTSGVVEQEGSDRTFAVNVTRPEVASIRLTVGFSSGANRPLWLIGLVVNVSESPAELALDQVPLFDPVPTAVSTGGPPGGTLVLAPRAGHDRALVTPSAERGPDGRWQLSDPVESAWVNTAPVTLGPGERLAFAYALVGQPGGSGVPAGRYRFEGAEQSVDVAVWRTSAPGPDPDSRFANRDLPPLSVDGTTVWYHESTPETALFLRPSTERVALPATVTYRFVNHARTVSGTRWLFLKLVDGEWYDLTPASQSLYRRGLAPGEVERWDLSLSHGPAEAERTAVGRLGGGRYAFVVDVGFSAVVRGALLSVDAPPLVVTADDDLSVSRNGGTVTVVDDSRAGGEHSAALTVERGDVAGERYIPEQVRRLSGLRNTLPLFETDVDRVVLRTDEDAVRNLLGRDLTLSLRVDGERYRIETGSPE